MFVALVRSVMRLELTLLRGLEHSADPQEIDDVEAFINRVVPNEEEPASTA